MRPSSIRERRPRRRTSARAACTAAAIETLESRRLLAAVHVDFQPQAAGAYCERVDEQHFDGSISQRIYNQIANADLLVAEMTGQNPNVFYETGYAHALNKRVILVTRDAKDIPFDLKDYPHIVYEGRISKLKDDLTRKLRWAVENPTQRLERADVELELFAGGERLRDGTTIVVPASGVAARGAVVRLVIDAHNGTTRMIDSKVGFGVIAPEEYVRTSNPAEVIALPGRKTLHLQKRSLWLPPDGWERVQWNLQRTAVHGMPTSFDAEIVLYGEAATVRIPVRIECAEKTPGME